MLYFCIFVFANSSKNTHFSLCFKNETLIQNTDFKSKIKSTPCVFVVESWGL